MGEIIISSDESFYIDLDTEIFVDKGIKMPATHPLKCEIDHEYFRPKFEEILKEHFSAYIQCEIPEIYPIIEDLIACLKAKD